MTQANSLARAQPTVVPTYAIDTFPMQAERSREVWEHVVDGTFQLEGSVRSDRGHRVRTRVWFLEELLLAAFEAEANVVHRTQALIDRNPAHVVKVRIYGSGHSLLINGDDQRTIGTGAIHFIDHDRPLRQVSTGHEQITLSVPYHVIGYDPSLHPACFSIGIETPAGRLLQAGLQAVLRELETLTPADAPALATALAGLLRGTLAGGLGSSEDQYAREARMAVVKQHIDQNIADPELGIDAVLRRVGASRATIYRDFAEEGGLQHYILRRRLQRAYRLLAEAAPVRGLVQEVASRCGFVSLAHFSRCFREGHGQTPSEVLGQWHVRSGRRAGLEAPIPSDAVRSANIAALQWAYKRFR